MSRLVALLIAALVALPATPAAACPPGPCNKYRRQFQPPPAPSITHYQRATPALPPTRLRDVARFLASSTWTPVVSGLVNVGTTLPVPPSLRFVFASRVSRREPVATERIVLIRRVARNASSILVEIDGEMFSLERCPASPRRWTSCLVPSAVPVDDVELDDSPGQKFATPPP